MKKAIIHIGMHKTGSTAIQSAYNGYNDGQTSFADLGYENHSIPLYTIFSNAENDYHIWRRSGMTPVQIKQKKSEYYDRLESCLIHPKTETIIFSGEDISLLPDAGVRNFSELLKGNGYAVRVIGYARSPHSFTVSFLQEYVKSDRDLSGYPHGSIYRERFEKFIKIFGRENVEIREYSKAALLNADILSDFAEFTKTQTLTKAKNENKGLSTEALRVTYLLNQMVGKDGDFPGVLKSRESCIQELRNLLPGEAHIPDEIISPLIKVEDVAWLTDCFGIDFLGDTLVSNAPFKPDHLKDYLSSPESASIETIYKYLKSHHSLPDLPQEPHVIVARLLMSFLPPLQSSHIQFDPQRYLELNPDVKAAGVDPYRHFVEYGMRELRRF